LRSEAAAAATSVEEWIGAMLVNELTYIKRSPASRMESFTYAT
jgi:hypothetical protein